MRRIGVIVAAVLAAVAGASLHWRAQGLGDESATSRLPESATAATRVPTAAATSLPSAAPAPPAAGDPGTTLWPALDIESGVDGGSLLRMPAPDGDGASGQVVVVVPAGIPPDEVEITALDGMAAVTWPTAAEPVSTPLMVAPGMEGLGTPVVGADGVVEFMLPGVDEASRPAALRFVAHPDLTGQEIYRESSGTVVVPAEDTTVPGDAVPFVLPSGGETPQHAEEEEPGVVRMHPDAAR